MANFPFPAVMEWASPSPSAPVVETVPRAAPTGASLTPAWDVVGGRPMAPSVGMFSGFQPRGLVAVPHLVKGAEAAWHAPILSARLHLAPHIPGQFRHSP